MCARVSSSPVVEVYLLVEQPRQRVSHWTQALAPLDGPDAPALSSVDAYYDASATTAIFGLRYDERWLGPERLRFVHEVARLAELGVIQPAELSEGDRRRFVTERLVGCAIHVADHRKVVGALGELVRRIRGAKAAASSTAVDTLGGQLVARPRPSTAPPGAHEQTNESMVLLAKGTRRNEPELARATRDGDGWVSPDAQRGALEDLPTRELARGSTRQPRLERDEAVPEQELTHVVSEPISVPLPAMQVRASTQPPLRERPRSSTQQPRMQALEQTADRLRLEQTADRIRLEETAERSRLEQTSEPLRRPRTQPGDRPRTRTVDDPPRTQPGDEMVAPRTQTGARTHALEPPRAEPPARPTPSPNVISRSGVHRANTVMLSPSETARMIEAARDAYEQHDVETQDSDATTEPFLPVPPEATTIYARYLRSGRWVPIRIGSLSLKGAALLTGALPRVDDHVDIALSFGPNKALVRGTVIKVSTVQEAALSGATTFHAAFELDDASRRQLTALLTAARAANVTIKPPPARSTRRFPVDWPVALGTTRGAVRADALDVSADGMFVRPVHPLALDARLTFTAVLDDGNTAVSGRARVVRSITEGDARLAGLAAGFGVAILEMTDADRERWGAFLTRIEKRASKRVLIGAAPARLAELQAGLIAAGYAVTGGTEPSAIAQLAAAERPVDAALIDAAWLAAGNSSAWVEQLFAGRNVPCVTMNGDARRARIAIDRLLAVV